MVTFFQTIPGALILLVVGFVFLIKGADFFVEGASAVANKLHVPPLVIGMTIVAMGTSLPELSVSVTASMAGSNQLAIGNVVGSNIFNILLILGTAAAISPLNFLTVNVIDTVILIVFSVIVWLMCVKKKRLERPHGIVMLLLYVAYTAYIIIRDGGIG